MVFTEDEEKANKLFVELRDKSLKDELPKDFFVRADKYLDKFEEYSLFKIIK